MQVGSQSIAATRADIIDGETSCAELLEQYLSAIDEGKCHNAFISILGESATKQAAAVVERLCNNRADKLAGAVFAAQVNSPIKRERLTCGSRKLENYRSPSYSKTGAGSYH